MRTCTTCGVTKPLSEFDNSKGRKYRRCKLCRRDSYKGRLYGLEPGQYSQMLEAQNHLCMICGKPSSIVWKNNEKPRLLSVDHDHETSQHRDLLCDRCNRGIGNFLDSPELLEAAAKYLRKWGK